MSWEKSYKAEEKMMNRGQKEASQDREVTLEILDPHLDPRKVEELLHGYRAALDRLGQRIHEVPPEWVEDLEKAITIQLEIKQKFAELDGLFKLRK